jgi:hypothetical protein
MSDLRRPTIERRHDLQLFYGWFDDVEQTEPTYSPPLGGPCALCGKNIAWTDDIRTHNLMYQGASYAKRSYFYYTHRSCAARDMTKTAADGFILDLIARNGD